ncbi:MAG: hypothetical protein ACI841_003323, partial [Planctomycetota bacterium]
RARPSYMSGTSEVSEVYSFARRLYEINPE